MLVIFSTINLEIVEKMCFKKRKKRVKAYFSKQIFINIFLFYFYIGVYSFDSFYFCFEMAQIAILHYEN